MSSQTVIGHRTHLFGSGHSATWQPPGLGSPQSGSRLRSCKTIQHPLLQLLHTFPHMCGQVSVEVTFLFSPFLDSHKDCQHDGGQELWGRSQDPIQDTRLHLPLCVWHLGPGTSSTFSKSQGGVLIWRASSCRGVVHIFNTNQSSTSSSGLHSFQHLATSTSAASPGKAASESERQDRRQLWDVAGDRSIRWSLGYLTLVLCQISEWYNP